MTASTFLNSQCSQQSNNAIDLARGLTHLQGFRLTASLVCMAESCLVENYSGHFATGLLFGFDIGPNCHHSVTELEPS
jgi:hypothetical protein